MAPTTKMKSAASNGRAVEPDLDAAFERVMRLMGIPGRSGEEEEVARFVVDELRRAGAPAAGVQFDDAHRHSPLKGSVGNLVPKPDRGEHESLASIEYAVVALKVEHVIICGHSRCGAGPHATSANNASTSDTATMRRMRSLPESKNKL